jgi:UDP-N-acetylglucosamine 2-epimerase
MLRVMTIVGTRPELIRLSRIIAKLDRYFLHTLVHTGQNYDYELNEIFFLDLGIRKPDFFLECAGSNATETIGRVIVESGKVMDIAHPDAILVLGDTNSSLSLISAKRRKIPTFHMEAGNRCFDQRVPEEINRKIADHTSDVNLPYSALARENLLRENLPPDLVITTGSPMLEVLDYYRHNIDQSSILTSLSLKQNEYILVSIHREENVNVEKNLISITSILNSLAKDLRLPIIVSTHPRTQKALDDLGALFDTLIDFKKPFGFFDYISLQKNAKYVLSDSGTITEESSILNFKAINLRECNERPEGFEEGAVMMAGLDYQLIKQAMAILEDQIGDQNNGMRRVEDYDVTNVSEKVIRIIQSYTSYVNRVVWKKY